MSTELIPAIASEVLPASNKTFVSHFQPAFTVQEAVARHNYIAAVVKSVLKAGIDYGKVPGTEKNTLFKPGAEKFCTLFGLSPRYRIIDKTEDWTGKDHGGEPLFYYQIKCELYRDGYFLGEGDGSCNSWETKYHYRWVGEHQLRQEGWLSKKEELPKRGGTITEFEFAVNKKETAGQYGKPAEYWARFQEAIDNGTARKVKKKKKDNTFSDAYEIDAFEYRIPNPSLSDLINTVLKMAAKRALIAAVLVVINASDYFTQDIEHLTPLDVSAIEVFLGTVDPEENPAVNAGPVVQESAEELLQRYYHRIAKKEPSRDAAIQQAFEELAQSLVAIYGMQAGWTYYSETLKEQGVSDPTAFQSTGPLRAALTRLCSLVADPIVEAPSVAA